MLARRPLHACVHARDLCSGLTRDVSLAFFFLCSFFSAVADSARVSDSDMKTMAAEIRKTTLVDKVAAFHKIPLKVDHQARREAAVHAAAEKLDGLRDLTGLLKDKPNS